MVYMVNDAVHYRSRMCRRGDVVRNEYVFPPTEPREIRIRESGRGISPGDKFGKLAVAGYQFEQGGEYHVHCECQECGAFHKVSVEHLSSNITPECKCETKSAKVIQRTQVFYGKTLREWSDLTGIPPETIRKRFKSGMEPEQVASKPVRRRK